MKGYQKEEFFRPSLGLDWVSSAEILGQGFQELSQKTGLEGYASGSTGLVEPVRSGVGFKAGLGASKTLEVLFDHEYQVLLY